MELEASKTYQIDLMGLNSEQGALPDPWLYGIRDSSGPYISGTGGFGQFTISDDTGCRQEGAEHGAINLHYRRVAVAMGRVLLGTSATEWGYSVSGRQP
ncbi:MAG: hypothetical protein OXU70_19665 [Gammaproteobacteria bacterium]|nr:hypothetical protein [Gammaproteobacteria bacterium]